MQSFRASASVRRSLRAIGAIAVSLCLAGIATGCSGRSIDSSTRPDQRAAGGSGWSSQPLAPTGVEPSISDDGRYLAFASSNDSLVPGDTNDMSDVFVLDRESGAIRRVSVNSRGGQLEAWSSSPDIAGNGRYVAYVSTKNRPDDSSKESTSDVFIYDLTTGGTVLASPGLSGPSNGEIVDRPAISVDGTVVAFTSTATNLVRGDTNRSWDVFYRQIPAHKTIRVSVSSSGRQANASSNGAALSADGSVVVFTSDASNLASAKRNAYSDVFVRRMREGRTDLISVSRTGGPGNGDSFGGDISADGNIVAFTTEASNLVGAGAGIGPDRSGVVARDLSAGTTELVSAFGHDLGAASGVATVGATVSEDAAVSNDGNLIAFTCAPYTSYEGAQETSDDVRSNVYVRDRRAARTEWVSGPAGDGPRLGSWNDSPCVAAAGRLIVYVSESAALVDAPENGGVRLFVSMWGVRR